MENKRHRVNPKTIKGFNDKEKEKLVNQLNQIRGDGLNAFVFDLIVFFAPITMKEGQHGTA